MPKVTLKILTLFLSLCVLSPQMQGEETQPGFSEFSSSVQKKEWRGHAPLLERALATTRATFPEKVLYPVDNILSFMQEIAKNPQAPDAFYTVDIGEIVRLYQLWKASLGTVTPFYAIKANPDPVLVNILAALGTGFDCASEGEIRQVLELGVSPERVIFAHPIKSIAALKYAEFQGVRKMVFDSIEELEKMRLYAPSGEFILRLKVDDIKSFIPLGDKFGASGKERRDILQYAKDQDVPIIGLSFHVGSNCSDVGQYQSALRDVLEFTEYSRKKHQRSFKLVDLGGGWPGINDEDFKKIARAIQDPLLQIGNENKVRIIAEPGRFFSNSVSKIAMRILGTKDTADKKRAYYLADGAYGTCQASFLHGHNTQMIAEEGWKFLPLSPGTLSPVLRETILWGPTCDSADRLGRSVRLPEMKAGEYILSHNVGAYARAAATNFNQIIPPTPYYVFRRGLAHDLTDCFQQAEHSPEFKRRHHPVARDLGTYARAPISLFHQIFFRKLSKTIPARGIRHQQSFRQDSCLQHVSSKVPFASKFLLRLSSILRRFR